jgi:hypothetical protein
MKHLMVLPFMLVGAIPLSAQYVVEFEVRQSAPLSAVVRTQPLSAEAATAAVEVAGGTPDYTYRWLPAAGLDNPNGARPLLLLAREGNNYALQVTDANGCTLSVEIEYTPPVAASEPTAISDARGEEAVQIHYDARAKMLHVLCAESSAAAVVRLINMQGQIMATGQGDYQVRISTATYPAGVYIVSVQTPEYQRNEKILIE